MKTSAPPLGAGHRLSGQPNPTDAGNICKAIGEPCRVFEIDDGDGRTIIIEPLRYHATYRRDGRTVVKQKGITR